MGEVRLRRSNKVMVTKNHSPHTPALLLKLAAVTVTNTNTAIEITKAQGHATTANMEAIITVNKYTDKAALKTNENVLKEAHTCIDGKTEQTLKSANDNTERLAVVAEF